MGVITSSSNYIIRNHHSTENYEDRVNNSTIPNMVVIEIHPDTHAPAPTPDEIGLYTPNNGFWYVKASDFTISEINPGNIYNPSNLFSTETFNPPNNAINLNSIGNSYNSGAAWRKSDMIAAVVADPSTDALTNWDDRVEEVMIVDYYNINNSPPLSLKKNKVFCYVRLSEEFIMPGENVTINVDIDGVATWMPLMVGVGSSDQSNKPK